MAQGVRVASVARGYDPRSCMLVVAGGAGPIHACDIAKELEMPLMLVPKASSVFCATGMLTSDLRHDYVRVHYALLEGKHIDIDGINSLLEEMKTEGLAILKKEGIPEDKMNFTYSADLRYEEQFNEIEIPIPVTDGRFSIDELPRLQQAFDEKHDTLYGYSLPGTTLELICLRVKAEGLTEKPSFKEMLYMGEDASSAVKGQRKIYYDKGFIILPIYDGNRMGHGNKVIGPAIIEEPTTTIFVTPDYQVTCDKYSNYLIYPKGTSLEEVINKLRK